MKIASNLYCRKSMLLKGLMLGCTVWLTVTVLLFMKDRRISPASNNEPSPGGGVYQQQQPIATAELMSDMIVTAVYENQLLDYDFSLKGGVKQKPAIAAVWEQRQATRTSSRRTQVLGSLKNGEGMLPQPKKTIFGEMGIPVVLPSNLTAEIKKLVDEGWKNNAFNQYASDLISVHRSLPDPRDEWCKKPGRYLDNLPQTSVIVCFHNEAWSVLLRTIHSILNRSPEHLIREIILVDDFSDMPHLKTGLEEYVLNYPKVKIIRAKKREGLIRARLMGSRYASASVLTYLDSHCECTEGWLEPLLDRIARESSTVVCPVIDVIDDSSLEFHYNDVGGVNVGGFDWDLQFNWHMVPEREEKRHKNQAEPVWSPTMAGGLFAIDKKFFERLGTYDSGFDIWGGENLELSFKTWMCGGTLEIVPCSHVGHIFRKRSPYKWRSGVNVLKKNSIRLAEVWMDDFSKYYYERIGNDLGDFGDITSRKELRRKLKCKSFKWYLENIYPELFIPGDALASGEVRNLGYGNNTCLDSPARNSDLNKPVGLYPCHKMGGNQYWMLSKMGEIRRDDACLDYAGSDVILYPCHGSKGNQYWSYNHHTKQLLHISRKECLAISGSREKLLMEKCDVMLSRQMWQFENFNATLSTEDSRIRH